MRSKQKIHVALNLMEILFSVLTFVWLSFFGNRNMTGEWHAIALTVLISLVINSAGNIYFVKSGTEMEHDNKAIAVVRFITRFFAALSTVALFLYGFLMVGVVLFASDTNGEEGAIFFLCLFISFAIFSLIVMINQTNFRKEQKMMFVEKQMELVNSIGTKDHE